MGSTGESATAPTGLTASAVGESSVTLTWNTVPGVEYWVFYGPTATAPTSVASMNTWISQFGNSNNGGGAVLRVTSPYVVTGLVNGTSYAFSVNGRVDGGPGGPGASPITASPRIAGGTWSAGSTATTGSTNLRAVAYGTTASTATPASTATYLAAGAGGAMFTSLDGSTWTASNFVTSQPINGATYLSTVYTVVGNGGLILTSTDLTTWSAPANPAASSGTNLYAVTTNGSTLNVAVGAGGIILTSPDSVNWTQRASPTTQDLNAVIYSPYNQGSNTLGTWVAVGNAGTVVESVDGGTTWTTVGSGGASANLRGVAYGSSTSAASAVTTAFVAVGSGGTVLTSTDGLTWTAQTLAGGVPTFNAVNATTTVGTTSPAVVMQYIVVGSGGVIFTSPDGKTWTSATSASSSALPTANLYAITRNTTVGQLGYVAVGNAGTTLLSR